MDDEDTSGSVEGSRVGEEVVSGEGSEEGDGPGAPQLLKLPDTCDDRLVEEGVAGTFHVA